MAEPQIYSVAELVGEMRQIMERSYPEIWIEGELSSLSKPASGHLYFSLKDETSQLRCAMFRNRASLSRYQPRSGDLVRVRAKISVYTARGDLQCIVQHIEDAGAGVLQRRYEELKNKLNAQGLFDQRHKQKIPALPRHIGLITSPSGAAIQDVLSTLERRNPGIPVTVYPAVVQGENAAASLLSALHDAEQHGLCDVLIMTRGGGSMEDLWCFNDEALARALFDSTLPIISAVGHEVDVTIADFVADLRAPTPTAAAELLSPEQSKMLADLTGLSGRLKRGFQRQQQQRAQTVDLWFNQLKHPRQSLQRQRVATTALSIRLHRATLQTNQLRTARLQQCRQRLDSKQPSDQITRYRLFTEQIAKQFRLAASRQHEQRQQAVANLSEQLNIVSPLATLGRGFAIAKDSHHNIVRNSNDVRSGDRVKVTLKQGSLDCEVIDLIPSELGEL